MAETVVIPEDFRKLMETQFGRVSDKVDGLAQAVNQNFVEIRKLLDDHENRLREQSAIDVRQGNDISALREHNARLEGDIRALAASMEGKFGELNQALKGRDERMDSRIEAMDIAMKARASRELDFWQRAALEAFRFAAFGVAAGGVLAGLGRALGVF